MKAKASNRRENAVSETIGFVLILGIVITGIGLVTLYGYPALIAQQAEANIKNMEKTMIVLQTDVNTWRLKMYLTRRQPFRSRAGHYQSYLMRPIRG